MNYWLHLALGYGFSVLVGHFLIRWTLSSLYVFDPQQPPDLIHAQLVGVVERVLYTTSWLLGHPEFIAVWLALKVAGQWNRWSEDRDGIPGRAFYNVFLIGSGLSILYGVTGALIVRWLTDEEKVSAAVCVPVILVVATLVFWEVTKRFPVRYPQQ